VLLSGFAMEKQSYQRKTKLTSRQGAAEQAERWRTRGFRVGFTNGCFDLLHPGHLSTLRQAKAACDYLVVAINSDASVKRLKGPSRPVQDETARTAILSALEMIDLVVVFDEDTPIEYIKAVKPDVLVKGGQYKLEEVVGYDLIASWGGKVVRAEMEDGFSTTNTIRKMAG
jgi:D-beta-D-heptose 7-phosphate kinase/D-beta-D-heptose 1-phosphate adenosyltransferase